MSKYAASDIVNRFVEYLMQTQTRRNRRETSYRASDDSEDSKPNASRNAIRDEDFSPLADSIFSDSSSFSESESDPQNEIQQNQQKCLDIYEVVEKLKKVQLMKIIMGRELIYSSDYFKVKWDIIIMAMALFNCFFVPIQVSFQPEMLETTGFEIANYIADFCFFLDICINFRTIYIDEFGCEHSSL